MGRDADCFGRSALIRFSAREKSSGSQIKGADLDPIDYRAMHGALGGSGGAIEPGTIVVVDSQGHYGRPRRTRLYYE